MTESPKHYWSEMPIDGTGAAPNVSLFRFLGHSGFDCAGRNVLEIGFGHGADLLEAKRRGAHIHGIDINAGAVQRMRDITGEDHFRCADAAQQAFDFPVAFDLIYSRDTIYYLHDDEIAAFAGHCLSALAPGGRLVLHFIEGDFVRDSTAPAAAMVNDRDWVKLEGSFAHGNPLRILDPERVASMVCGQGAILTGSKTLCETYGIVENQMRRQRYFMFRIGQSYSDA